MRKHTRVTAQVGLRIRITNSNMDIVFRLKCVTLEKPLKQLRDYQGTLSFHSCIII